MKKFFIPTIFIAILVFCGWARADINLGLVAYYPFNGNANDESGNGNHGIAYGASLTTDKRGNSNSAYSFDGIDDFITISNNPSLNFGTNDFSLSAWIMTAGYPRSNDIINKFYYDADGKRGYLLNVHPTTGGLGFYCSSPSSSRPGIGGIVGSTFIGENSWHHVAGVRQGNLMTIYIDGVVDGIFEDAGELDFSSQSPLYIGAQIDGYGRTFPFLGLIDEVRVYNRALSEAEIRQLADIMLETGLIAYYPFNGSANDESGNGNHGIEHGGVSYSPGVQGLSANFDGYDDYIITTNVFTFDTSTPKTTSAWVKLYSSGGGGCPDSWGARGIVDITGYNQDAGSLYNHNCKLDGEGVFAFYNGGPGGADVAWTIPNVIELNRWYHLVGVAQNGSLTFYLNGKLTGTVFHVNYNNDSIFSTTIEIGRHYQYGWNYLHGSIDEVRIYDRALNECEIQLLYGVPCNSEPSALAGPNLTISSIDQTQAVIQGTASDPDSDPLTYRWLEGETELSAWQEVGLNGEANLDLATVDYLSIGEHTLILEVSDGQTTAFDTMILTVGNSAPNVSVSGAGTYEISTPVILGGEVSDFDGDTLVYKWLDAGDVLYTGNQATVQGGTPVTLPEHFLSDLSLGTHVLTLSVDDGINAPITAQITLEISDSTAPILAPVANKTILWPPNHKMVDTEIQANAQDNSGGPVTLSAAISSNEPQSGQGNGDKSPDWTVPVIDRVIGVISFQLRSERSGSGSGRVYSISVTATDDSGNSSQANVQVIVPHDQGR